MVEFFTHIWSGFTAHAPVLLVVAPMMLAGVIVLCNNARLAFVLTACAVAISAAAVLSMFIGLQQSVAIDYLMGNWPKPIGIAYKIDRLALFILAIITYVPLLLLPFAHKSVMQDVLAQKQPLFYALFLLCLSGLMGIVATHDIFNLYVFLEISSLSTYALIAAGRDKRALTASFDYLILGTVGASFILIAIGFLYILTGTLHMSDMAARLASVTDSAATAAAFAFFTIGIMLKVAIFPLHIWLTNAYAYAPNFISAFLSATATKVSLYVALRLMLDVFGVHYSFLIMPAELLFLVLGVVGILVASAAAIFQTNVKRLLAFSSIGQMGYVLLGIGLASALGFTASITHLFNHALAKALLFVCAGAVVFVHGHAYMQGWAGLFRRYWLVALGVVIGGLSLIGVPGTAGFVSKMILLRATLQSDMWWLVIPILFSSLLAVIYIWKIVEAMLYTQAEQGGDAKNIPLPIGFTITIILLIGANIYFAFDTRLNVEWVASAVQQWGLL